MKKIFTLLFVAATGLQLVQAQSFVVYKNGEAVAVYAASDVDSLVFVPGQPSLENYADIIAGDYHATRSAGLQGNPGFAPVKSEVNVKITAEGTNKVSIVLPGMVFNGMTLPSITVAGIEVFAADGAYTFAKDVQGVDEVSGNKYTVKLKGIVKADGTFSFSEEMKYGKMPFTLEMKYIPFVKTLAVAGDYRTKMKVTLKEMPDMGVLVDTVDTVKFVENGSDFDIILPAVNYQAMGVQLPSVTLEKVEMVDKDGVHTFAKKVNGKEEETGKDYSVDFSGQIKADGSFAFSASMRYGKMPFTILLDFTPETK